MKRRSPSYREVNVKKFTRNFVYQWLHNAVEGLKIFEKHNATHYEAYGNLETDSKVLFGSYVRFRDISDTDLMPQVVWDSPVFYNYYAMWSAYFRAPIRSRAGPQMKRLKVVCKELMDQVAVARAMIEAYDIENEMSDYYQLAEDLTNFPDVEEVIDPEIPMRFSENVILDLSPTEELVLYGLRPEKAIELSEAIGPDEAAVWRAFLKYIKSKDNILGLKVGTSKEYSRAAEDLGMSQKFCREIGNPKKFWLVGSAPLEYWIEEVADCARVKLTTKEIYVPVGHDTSDVDKMEIDKPFYRKASLKPSKKQKDKAKKEVTTDTTVTGSVEPIVEPAGDDPIEEATAARKANEAAFKPLYHGSSVEKITAFLNAPEKVRVPSALFSTRASDFSLKAAMYTAESKPLAQHYGKMKKRLSADSGATFGVMTVWIQNEVLKKLETHITGDHWKRFIYYNRLGGISGRIDSDLVLYQNADILHGLTSGGNEKTFGKIKDWKKVKEIALPSGCPNSIQFAFRTNPSFAVLERMEAAVEGV